MRCTPPLFRWRSKLPFAWLCVGLAACVTAETGAGAAAHGITEIAIERDCFGCDNAGALRLRSDGSALLTRVGKARHGTQDEVREGRISPAEFDGLARLLLQRGFFELKDRYEDPDLQDGAWTTVHAVRGTQRKAVFVREDAAPPELKAVENAIDALRSRIRPLR